MWAGPEPAQAGSPAPPHRFTGRSVSSSFRMDLPSMSVGMSRPAMSRMVGARSMLRTMWGFLGAGRVGTHPLDTGSRLLGRGAAGGGGFEALALL